MNTKDFNVKLSKRFYTFSIVFGLLLGALFSSILIRPIAKNFIKNVDKSLYTYRDGSPDTFAYSKAKLDARASAEGKVAPFVLIVGGVLFVLVFVIVGRHRQPASLNEEGVYVWNWLGKKHHLWKNYQDKSIIKVKSTGLNVSRFEQFHFSTGTVSVNTKRLENGEEVLLKMDKMTNKA
ncbi:MAG: hypothetical protein UZ10_BCD003002270 [Bacteroidetes bacterium OLB10]|nr:MAG: hypothetical protein UZ10_BCD003002270 [Bacteroidetes bacterium OLB10]